MDGSSKRLSGPLKFGGALNHHTTTESTCGDSPAVVQATLDDFWKLHRPPNHNAGAWMDGSSKRLSGPLKFGGALNHQTTTESTCGGNQAVVQATLDDFWKRHRPRNHNAGGAEISSARDDHQVAHSSSDDDAPLVKHSRFREGVADDTADVGNIWSDVQDSSRASNSLYFAGQHGVFPCPLPSPLQDRPEHEFLTDSGYL